MMPISDPRDRFFYPHHTPIKDTYILTCGIEFVLFFRGAGKFCHAHMLRQLALTLKRTSKILNFRSDVTYALSRKTPMMFKEGCYAT